MKENIESFANELALINPNLIVKMGDADFNRLAFVSDINGKQYAILTSLEAARHCTIEKDVDFAIKLQIQSACKNSNFDVFDRDAE